MMNRLISLAVAALAATPLAADPANYPTPQDAFDAMISALEARDREALLVTFGPEAEDLLYSDDPQENRANRNTILALYGQGFRFAPLEDGELEIVLGEEGWPFPVPLARSEAGWAFDIEAGREEVEDRELGFNELEVIDLMAAYVDLQVLFRLTDYDGDGIMEFASSIISSPDRRDGLFWPGPDSPVGAQLARASADGFSDGETDYEPDPFMGYYFRILHAQGPAAPGGEMSYLVGENLVSGHALLAYPSDYGETGIHSFMVSENGEIVEADLGEDTLAIAAEITTYDPGEAWSKVE
jgi:hypothetical protein